MLVEAVVRVRGRVFVHDPVAGHFRQNRRRRDGKHFAVAHHNLTTRRQGRRNPLSRMLSSTNLKRAKHALTASALTWLSASIPLGKRLPSTATNTCAHGLISNHEGDK